MILRMRTVRVALGTLLALLLLQGCEDDPILEPIGDDDTGGGSYGNLSPVSPPQAAELRPLNPETF